MKDTQTFPANGVACQVINDLVPARPKAAPTKIGMVGVGLKMHFVWAEASRLYRAACEQVRALLPADQFELCASEEAYESPEELLKTLDKLKAEGIEGVILFHGSYTAGEIGSQMGRWLRDHRMPLFSWAYPEVKGGRLTANSLCCQNFVLNAFKRLGVRYTWMFKSLEAPGKEELIGRFARSVRAYQRFRNGKGLIVGTGRVPGFYDAECDELSVMDRFGFRFDRIGLEYAFDEGDKFSDADVERVRKALTEAPQCGYDNVPAEQAYKTIRLALGTLRIAGEGGHIGCALKCWPELFDLYKCAADGALSMINDYGLPAADESDMNGLISMCAMHLVREGESIPTLMDISLLDPQRNVLGFWHCGGSATRLLRQGTKYECRRHSILENADEETAWGLLVESLLELGPVTATRYLSPDSSRAFTFEGNVVDSPMAFRGAYADVEPSGPHTAEQLMGTILDNGFDHHWVMGRGHFAKDLSMLNHWLDVKDQPVTNNGGSCGLSA
ncbi:fucose isomerase [Ruficoccus amylovorans]|uniref:Fucose isomerase n=1 Tax=Ruficoccus amylovorans TaxID=1804625 RepID=A0A842HBE1_9BACT|nr:fucose isomerase [Ruficoccus amylovorans]MBC2593469.1 fucose isomerase [Ruficoccus amylovorans]